MLSKYSAQYLVFFFQCIHSLIRVCHCSLSYAAVQKGVSFLGVTNKWNQNSLASHIYKWLCFIQLHLCRTSPFPRYPCAVVPDWKTSAPWEVQTPSSWAALMGPGRHSGWVCIHAVNVFVWPFLSQKSSLRARGSVLWISVCPKMNFTYFQMLRS